MPSPIRGRKVLEILQGTGLDPSILSQHDPRWERLRSRVDRGVSLPDRYHGAPIGGAIGDAMGRAAERGRVTDSGSSRPAVAANLRASGSTIRSESRKPGGIIGHGACLTRRRLLIELAAEPRLAWGIGGIQ